MSKNYKYTKSWFSTHNIEKVLSSFNVNDELHMIEIGSFEGKSTVWFLENILKNEKSTITCIDPWTSYSQNENTFNSYDQTKSEWDFTENEDIYKHNINESGFSHKVTAIKGLSNKVLPKLHDKNKLYDIIFIDGNHTSAYVLIDAVLCWDLLKVGGVMMFDDYLWRPNLNPLTTPKLAIDSFTKIFSPYIENIPTVDGYLKAIKKLK